MNQQWSSPENYGCCLSSALQLAESGSAFVPVGSHWGDCRAYLCVPGHDDVYQGLTNFVITPFLPRAIGFICISLIILCSSMLSAGVQAAPDPAAKTIVVLSSYDPELPHAQRFIAGLVAERKRLNEKLDFFFEFIDHRRLGQRVSFGVRADFLKAKYSGRKIDAVIIESRFAQRFIESQGEYVFGKVPYVLVSSLKADRSKLAVSAQVMNPDWLPGNVALIKHLYPGARNIAVIGGSSKIARAFTDTLEGVFSGLYPAVQVQTILGLPLVELKQALARLPKDTIVLYTVYFQAPDDTRHIPREVLQELVPYAPGPVFGLYRTYLGTGVMGGNMVSPEQSAKDTLTLALQLIANGAPVPLRARGVYSQVAFDARVLEKAGISRTQLPPGSEVLFERVPFYETYFVETVSLFSFMLVLLVALGVTLSLYLQKRRYSDELARNKNMLELRVAQRTEALQQMAMTDHLTGLANRAAFYGALGQQVDAEGCFVLAILDIDDFKKINDRYGHPGGDKALQVFAQGCQQSLRTQDVIGRIGGEEFACLLPDTPLDEALAILQQLCRNIAAGPVELEDGRVFHLTVSVGLVESAYKRHDSDALLQLADQQLYIAKWSGKNRVCCEGMAEGSIAAG